jgi:glycosyltransferase involved in cell wall biosynthesis
MSLRKTVIFIAILLFVFSISVPFLCSNFIGGKISTAENRVLVEFPQIFNSDGKLKWEFKKEFESWINDNIGFRDAFLKLNALISVNIFNTSPNSTVKAGKNGWYFYTPDHNLNIANGTFPLTDDDLLQIKEVQESIQKALAKKGIEYVILLIPSKTNIYPEIEQFSDFFDLKKTYIINISRPCKIKGIYVFIKLLLFLIRMHIDIIHLTFIYDLTLLFLHNKIFLMLHDPIPHSDVRSKKDFLYRKIAFHFIKNYILANRNQKDEFISKYKLKQKNIYITRFGIYNYLHRYVNSNAGNERNNEKEYILFFGRITSYKGLDFLFPAMKIVNETHNIKLVVAGYCQKYYFDISGYNNCPYIEIINKFIPDNELAALIQNSLFVVCPYTDATQSGVVMSSFAFDVPVLATDVGGLKEYVEHEKSGYIVSAKNIAELANGIKYLLDHRDLLSEQKKYICEKYKDGNHSWDKITDEIIEFYKMSGKKNDT